MLCLLFHTITYRRYVLLLSHNSSVGVTTGYGRDGRGSIPGRDKNLSLLHSVQTGCEAKPASYPMGTRSSFPGVNAAPALTPTDPHIQ
jgi:hypothetical protein